ncbi:MAG: sugar kinase [Candidatus Competibacteraceae bacterium]|nr:sugar kinase [Candidatus Competibacteraceae bacterium]
MLEFNQDPKDGRYLQGHGGDTSNTAIAAARQGGRVGYLTAVGADPFGQSFLDLWAAEGIDTSQVKRTGDAPTGIYFVTHGPEGHVFSYYRAGSAASRMTPADMPLPAIRAAKAIHLSGISLAISTSACDACFSAVQAARDAGTKVSFDTNLRLKLWPVHRARAVMNEMIALCDICLPSYDDIAAITGLTVDRGEAFWLQGTSYAVMKLRVE